MVHRDPFVRSSRRCKLRWKCDLDRKMRKVHMGVSKNWGKPWKWMVKIMEKPYFLMDDLGGKPTIYGNCVVVGVPRQQRLGLMDFDQDDQEQMEDTPSSGRFFLGEGRDFALVNWGICSEFCEGHVRKISGVSKIPSLFQFLCITSTSISLIILVCIAGSTWSKTFHWWILSSWEGSTIAACCAAELLMEVSKNL